VAAKHELLALGPQIRYGTLRMRTLTLKPNHKRIAAYHVSLAEFEKLGVKHETPLRAAFQALLEDCTALVNRGRVDKWKLVPEYSLKTKAGAKITPDGALLDSFRLTHGLWEAKDTADDLDKEITKKFKLGYPRDNILFQSPARAVLVQTASARSISTSRSRTTSSKSSAPFSSIRLRRSMNGKRPSPSSRTGCRKSASR
jgi:hypothetical protein